MLAPRWDMPCQKLLLALSNERWVLRRECIDNGRALDCLLELGMAKVMFTGKQGDGSDDGITLTEMGWAQVARIQERNR